MNLLTSIAVPSDSSSCDESPGPVTPEHSPRILPLTFDGNMKLHDGHCAVYKLPNARVPTHDGTTALAYEEAPSFQIQTVCFIGAGYVGGPTAAIMALHNPHVRFEVVDRNESRIKRWNTSHLPIHEPGLNEIVRVARDGATVSSSCRGASHSAWCTDFCPTYERQSNLAFTTNVAASISRSDMVVLAVNTPTKTFGVGAGSASDMSILDSAVRQIAAFARSGTIIVEKSTVPCGTATRIRSVLRSLRPNTPFHLLSNPEFLAEGSAVNDLVSPDRVIIGCDQTPYGNAAAAALSNLYAAWIPTSRILLSNIWSSELSKLVANAMLAQRISSINSISAICERTGADVSEITQAIGSDTRIGSQFLKAGLGFGGSCFRKDIASLTYIAESLGLSEVAHYWSQVNSMNNFQRQRFARNVIQRLDGNLVDKKIAVLGFAFKQHTSDARESIAAEVVKILSAERPAKISIFDQFCRRVDILQELTSVGVEDMNAVEVHHDVYQACFQADAILLITDCDLFRNSGLNEDGIDASSEGDESAMRYDTNGPAYSTGAPDAAGTVHLNVTRHGNRISYRLNQEQACNDGPSICPQCDAHDQSWLGKPVQWSKILENMRQPRWIFDGRNILNVGKLRRLGLEFHLESIGRSFTVG